MSKQYKCRPNIRNNKLAPCFIEKEYISYQVSSPTPVDTMENG